MSTTFIYVLKEPGSAKFPCDGKIRYVGKSNDPYVRFEEHLANASKLANHKDAWIFSTLQSGETPVLEILDEVPMAEWEFWEREYIRLFRAIGVNLTNLTDGGEGITRGSHSKETRLKMSIAKKGKPSPKRGIKITSIETLDKMRKAATGKKHSPEHIEKIRLANVGKHNNPNSLKNLIPGANRGHPVSLETKEKLRNARLGKHLSEASRAKVSAARRAFCAKKREAMC